MSISLDELAIGFNLGLAGSPNLPVIIVIAVQAFLAVQLGLALGTRVGERLRENAERLAALALSSLGLFVLGGRLTCTDRMRGPTPTGPMNRSRAGVWHTGRS